MNTDRAQLAALEAADDEKSVANRNLKFSIAGFYKAYEKTLDEIWPSDNATPHAGALEGRRAITDDYFNQSNPIPPADQMKGTSLEEDFKALENITNGVKQGIRDLQRINPLSGGEGYEKLGEMTAFGGQSAEPKITKIIFANYDEAVNTINKELNIDYMIRVIMHIQEGFIKMDEGTNELTLDEAAFKAFVFDYNTNVRVYIALKEYLDSVEEIPLYTKTQIKNLLSFYGKFIFNDFNEAIISLMNIIATRIATE